MLKQFAAVLVAVSGLTALAAAQQTTQQDLARTLRDGALNDRHQAARDVLQIPPGQRGETLWVALANELQSVTSEYHERDDALAAGRQLPSPGPDHGEDHGDYHADLIKGVAQWSDPRALRPLISVAGGRALPDGR